MPRLAEAYIEITGRKAPLDRTFRQANRATRQFVGGQQRMLGRLGAAFAGMFSIYAFKAMLTGSIRVAADFHDQMNMVATMLDRTSMRYLPAYRKELQRLSTEFGEATGTLAKGLYDILSASVAPGHAIKVLNVAVMAARAGMTDTATAARVLTQVMNAYGMEVTEATRVSDMLFATVKRAVTTFPQLANALGQVTSTAALAGVPLEELLATLATLTKAGLNTEMAVVAINQAILTYLRPMGMAAEQAEKLGIDLSLAGLRSKGLIGAMAQLTGLSADLVAAIFPNKRALRAVAIAAQNTGDILTNLEGIFASAGDSQEALGKTTKGLGHDTRTLGQDFKQLGRSIGEVFGPAFTAVVGESVNMLNDFMAALKGAAGVPLLLGDPEKIKWFAEAEKADKENLERRAAWRKRFEEQEEARKKAEEGPAGPSREQLEKAAELERKLHRDMMAEREGAIHDLKNEWLEASKVPLVDPDLLKASFQYRESLLRKQWAEEDDYTKEKQRREEETIVQAANRERQQREREQQREQDQFKRMRQGFMRERDRARDARQRAINQEKRAAEGLADFRESKINREIEKRRQMVGFQGITGAARQAMVAGALEGIGKPSDVGDRRREQRLLERIATLHQQTFDLQWEAQAAQQRLVDLMSGEAA